MDLNAALLLSLLLLFPVAAPMFNPYDDPHQHPYDDIKQHNSEFMLSSVDAHETRDLHALLSFRKAVTADPSGWLSDWTAENSENVCSWLGISCRPHTKRVVAIEIVDGDLEGTLSPCIGNLSLLRTLDLRINDFTGGIPPEFGQLKVLGELNLGENLISGFIPVELGRLQNLKYLDLYGNKISGSIPRQLGEIPTSIGSMSHLRLLNLSHNQLDGKIPTSLSGISTLEQLDLANNNLSGSIPEELSKLHELAVLDVSSNNLCGQIPTGTQFSTFNVSSFQKNRCLWGCPLESCNVNERPVIKGDNVGNSSNVRVGWLGRVDEKMSLIAVGMGIGIGFGGVVGIFMLWERAKQWVVPPNMPRPFFGVYRFPT